MQMAATGISSIRVRRRAAGITAVLIAATCEWFLIVLLLVNGVLSYLLTKFASYCNLQLPCILCSRFDYLLSSEKPKLYQHLLCSNHRSEISSLISCHLHDTLADGSAMCDDCLLSFIMKNKSNRITNALLVGILGTNRVARGSKSPVLNKDLISDFAGSKLCSCCFKSRRATKNAHRSLLLQSRRSGVTKPCITLPRKRLKKIKGKLSGSVTSHHLGNGGFDLWSHVGYSELKITSDSESELPTSDDDNNHEQIEPNEEFPIQCASEFPRRVLSSGLEKHKSPLYHMRPSLLDPCVHPDARNCEDVKFLASKAAFDSGLVEPSWQKVNQKSGFSALPELSPDKVPLLVDVMEVPHEESTDSTLVLPLCQSSNSTAVAELITLHDSHPSLGASPEKSDVTGRSDSGHVSINEYDEVLKLRSTTIGACAKGGQAVNDFAVTEPTPVDPGEECQQAVRREEREVSNIIAEKLPMREPNRVNEELKLLPAHACSVQQIHLSSNGTSASQPGWCGEQQKNDTSSSNGTWVLQKSVSVESSLESSDGSLSEIENESLLDRLKRQVECDSKCISALYKELEEERNASAVAVNQAMAMITRLQEEKAALRTEALQYLRMMEEQAEYDLEALEKANDLLAEKEKEIQDLEAEVEFCRSNFHIQAMAEIILEGRDLKGENVILE